MSFQSFYFNNSKQNSNTTLSTASYFIEENEYNRLVDLFEKDYKYFIEKEEFKNDWGYGFKYQLKNNESVILLNKFKDEVENSDSMIQFLGESGVEIMKNFKINIKEEVKNVT